MDIIAFLREPAVLLVIGGVGAAALKFGQTAASHWLLSDDKRKLVDAQTKSTNAKKALAAAKLTPQPDDDIIAQAMVDAADAGVENMLAHGVTVEAMIEAINGIKIPSLVTRR